MGMGDSTLSGQTYFLNINKGFCNGNGPCTVLAGQVGILFEDGTIADPSKGALQCNSWQQLIDKH
jgi:hypothetical protein